MDRVILNHEVLCGPVRETVKIEFVYNYIYDLYSESTALLEDIGGIAKELDAAKKQYELYIELAGKAIFDKEEKERITEYLDAADKLKKIAKEKAKEVRALDKKLRLEGIFPLIEGVLTDNGYTGNLLKFNYWDRKVDHGQAWKFVQAVIAKDNEGKKKDLKK